MFDILFIFVLVCLLFQPKLPPDFGAESCGFFRVDEMFFQFYKCQYAHQPFVNGEYLFKNVTLYSTLNFFSPPTVVGLTKKKENEW